MNLIKNIFGKEEKLCSDKGIESLYKTGSSFLNHPIVVYYLALPDMKITKILISVSKKKYKHAVDRNLLKRRLREAYRLNKSILEKKYYLAFVYVGNEILSYQQIEKSMILGLKKIAQEKFEV